MCALRKLRRVALIQKSQADVGGTSPPKTEVQKAFGCIPKGTSFRFSHDMDT